MKLPFGNKNQSPSEETFKKQLEDTLNKNKDNKMLQSLLKNPQVQNAFKNLSSDDIQKIQQVLNNPNEAKNILATKEAKEKLNDMMNNK